MMRGNAVRKVTDKHLQSEVAARPEVGFGPAAVSHSHSGNGLSGFSGRVLRMYTEEEVSGILQVSLSQLRKWRMKGNRGGTQGPPFKKIGRLVRYPEQGLLDYINSR
jgi:hypothetical protein